MSTATLLFLATSVRDHGRAHGPHAERRHLLRPGRAGAGLPMHSLSRQAEARTAGAVLRCSASRAHDLNLLYRLLAALALLVPGLADSTALAQPQDRPAATPPPTSTDPDRPTRIGGTMPDTVCVQVDVAGHKAGHLDCVSRKLEAAARTAQAQARSGIDTPVIDASSPDVRTGVANQTATRQRMGNSFGTSVQPQRPNRPPSVPRPGGRP